MERNGCILVMRYEKQKVGEEIKREVKGKTGKKKRKCGQERLRMMSGDKGNNREVIEKRNAKE